MVKALAWARSVLIKLLSIGLKVLSELSYIKCWYNKPDLAVAATTRQYPPNPLLTRRIHWFLCKNVTNLHNEKEAHWFVYFYTSRTLFELLLVYSKPWSQTVLVFQLEYLQDCTGSSKNCILIYRLESLL